MRNSQIRLSAALASLSAIACVAASAQAQTEARGAGARLPPVISQIAAQASGTSDGLVQSARATRERKNENSGNAFQLAAAASDGEFVYTAYVKSSFFVDFFPTGARIYRQPVGSSTRTLIHALGRTESLFGLEAANGTVSISTLRFPRQDVPMFRSQVRTISRDNPLPITVADSMITVGDFDRNEFCGEFSIGTGMGAAGTALLERVTFPCGDGESLIGPPTLVIAEATAQGEKILFRPASIGAIGPVSARNNRLLISEGFDEIGIADISTQTYRQFVAGSEFSAALADDGSLAVSTDIDYFAGTNGDKSMVIVFPQGDIDRPRIVETGARHEPGLSYCGSSLIDMRVIGPTRRSRTAKQAMNRVRILLRQTDGTAVRVLSLTPTSEVIGSWCNSSEYQLLTKRNNRVHVLRVPIS